MDQNFAPSGTPFSLYLKAKSETLLNRSDQYLADNSNCHQRRCSLLSRYDRRQDGSLLAAVLRGDNTPVDRSISVGRLGCW